MPPASCGHARQSKASSRPCRGRIVSRAPARAALPRRTIISYLVVVLEYYRIHRDTLMLTQTHIFSVNGTHATYTLQYIPILAFSECAFVRKFQCQTANTKHTLGPANHPNPTGPRFSRWGPVDGAALVRHCRRGWAEMAVLELLLMTEVVLPSSHAAGSRSPLPYVFECFPSTIHSLPYRGQWSARPGPTVSVFFGVLNVLHC